MKELFVDDRRVVIIPGNHAETLEFCINHWLEAAEDAIADHGFFAVALSGGSTPKAIYKGLVASDAAQALDWSKVFFFWSDERSVPPSHEESNYHMAMEEGGLHLLPIPRENVFRMVAETEIEENAKLYEEVILRKLGGHAFDLIMLGMGEDGHTASLFPHTEALHAKDRLVVANFIPQKNTWRMTFTYACINAAQEICLYVLGDGKKHTLVDVLMSPLQPEKFPSQFVGTSSHKATWIADEGASGLLQEKLSQLKKS